MSMQEQKLKAIADAIRAKDGTLEPISAQDFPERIRAIPSGGINLERIEITAPPAKADYLVGESFDTAGMTVTAVYSNGARLDVTEYSVEPSGTLTEGVTEVTVGYTEGGVSASAPVAVTVSRAIIQAAPSQKEALTYTGEVLSPEWEGYNPAQLTLEGELTGTNAGSYSVVFTPKEGCEWADGTAGGKTVAWSIAKAAGGMSLSASSVTLDPSQLTQDVTVTRVGGGAVTAVSSDANVAAASVSGNVVTISHVNRKTGTATITIQVAEDENHTAPADETVAVTAKFLPDKKPLNDMTWDEIRQISDAGEAANYWSVGDYKEIVLNGKIGNFTLSNYKTYAVIIGFNHNAALEGENRIHFQIGKRPESGRGIALCDSSYDRSDGSLGSNRIFHMHSNGGISGGWNASYIKNNTCPAFENVIPSDLRSNLKSVTKYTDNVGAATKAAEADVTATTDRFFLLSEYEVSGKTSFSNVYEASKQAQYDYYKAGNSAKRYKHTSTTTVGEYDAVYWWLRSPSRLSIACNLYVEPGGGCNYNRYGTTTSIGFAPGFCV